MPPEPWPRPGIERIVLVGFMAAGKSTVGRLLAARLGWRFEDFDDRIAEETGRSPGALIRESGEAVFREAERRVTRSLAGSSAVVLAPGGGWGADPDLAAALGPGTVRVWLRVRPAEAVRRAEAQAVDRPLLGAPGPGRTARAESLLRARERAYGAAEIAVDVNGRGPEAVADEIVRRLEADSGG